MLELIGATAAFVAIHSGLSATRLRDGLVARIGEAPYRGLYSLASLALLIWLVSAYQSFGFSPDNTVLWQTPAALGHGALLLIVLGLVLAIIGLLTPSPTLAGAEGLLNRPEPARGVLRITRHPFLWGVSLWAAGHLSVNGDVAGVLLFGGLLLVSLPGTRSIDRKSRMRNPEAWSRFAAATSNVPFAALLARRARLDLAPLLWRIPVAVLLVGGVYHMHAQWFGAAPRILGG